MDKRPPIPNSATPKTACALGGMKYLILGLLAFTLTLGVACKKESVVEPEKQETTFSTKKLALANPDDDGLEAKHSAACIKGEGRPMDYTCPGPSSCNPPK